MSIKIFAWGASMAFSLVWSIVSSFGDDKIKKEGASTRATVFIAAALIILAIPD